MIWAAETYVETLKVGKMEVDANPSTRDSYQVQGIPTLALCLLYTSPSPRDPKISRMPSSA